MIKQRNQPVFERSNVQLEDFTATQGLVQQKSINNEELFNSILEPTKVETAKSKEAASFAQDFAEM